MHGCLYRHKSQSVGDKPSAERESKKWKGSLFADASVLLWAGMATEATVTIHLACVRDGERPPRGSVEEMRMLGCWTCAW